MCCTLQIALRATNSDRSTSYKTHLATPLRETRQFRLHLFRWIVLHHSSEHVLNDMRALAKGSDRLKRR